MKKSLKFKIILVYLIILFVSTGSSVWALINFNSLSKSIDSIMESNYKSIQAAQNMIIAIERQDSAELAHMFSQSSETVDAFKENEKIFLMWLTRAEDNITEIGEEEILNRINDSYSQYIISFTKLISLNNIENSNALNDYYYNEVLPLFESTKDASRELLTLNQSSMLERKEYALEVSEKASYSTLVISGLIIVLGLILVSVLSNKIVKPLYDFIEKIKKISEGNYNQKLNVSGNDEIALLAREFNIMANKLVDYDEMNIKNLLEEKNKSDAIVSSISDGIVVTDNEFKILLLNHKAEKTFNIRESEVVGRHILETIKNSRLFDLFEYTKKNTDRRLRKKYDDIEVVGEGKVEFFRVSVRPIRMKNGATSGYVALIQDITKLKEVDQIKSDFISTVSHEFRTPLTSIIMGVGLLLEEIPGKMTDKQKELIEAMKEDSERLSKLVSELLDLSKLESGKLQMDFQQHPISDVFSYVEKVLKVQADEIGAKIEVLPIEHLKNVKIDLNKITWVMTNLIANALRYVPKDGTGKIEISVKEVYGKQIISVKDNGAGMSDSVQKKIFEKFVQVSDNHGGAGLGLAICKEIIKAHGGDIWVESKKNEGSTFYFTVNAVD